MTDKKKPETGQVWVWYEDVPAEPMPSWEAQRVLAHGDDMMLVENHFKVGDTAPMHSHPHAQITYVIKGEIYFTIDEESQWLRTGDSVYIRPDAVHGGIATKETVVIDAFTPQREDFLD